MTMKDVQAFKKELLELDAELKRFKGEILAARIEQLKQTIRKPTSRLRASKCAMPARPCCQTGAKA